jgi:hypothetical protein
LYILLRTDGVTPSAFEQRLAALPESETVEGFVLLLSDTVGTS